jgi:pyruvate,water dikinase
MPATPKYVLDFKEVDKHDIPQVGGKAANLGEMVKAGFPVPGGFCLTAGAYREMIAYNQFDEYIRSVLRSLDVSNSEALNQAAGKIKAKIRKANIPPEMVRQIFDHYHSLKRGLNNPHVAVRSSATAEDLPDASFAGQQATFLNVRGEANLIQAIRGAWASLFEPRAIFYRETKGFDHFKVALAVPVQLMVQSQVSGVMFTINPVTNNKNIIVIEAIWGLGEKIVQGAYTPDHYEVTKDQMRLRSKVVSEQKVQYIRHGDGNKELPVPIKYRDQAKLDEKQILELAEIGIKLQKHYFFPQDVEWAADPAGKIFIVQTRPITTIENIETKKTSIDASALHKLKLVLKGDAASPGIVSGTVRIVRSIKEIGIIKDGDVLVTSMTTPDYVPAMRKAVAIVTDKGGQTSHAAIVSRELGVPAVVGTKTATKDLKVGQTVTVNGGSGEIWSGKLPPGTDRVFEVKSPATVGGQPIKTATNVYVNLGEPDLAASVATRDVDGIGLLRAEFLMAQIGHHPKQLIHEKKQAMFVDKLAEGLEKFCSAFGYRPVVYRASDFKTNEYRNLKGGAKFEPEEPNPMLGYRGAYRYITDEKVFELELEAIKRVRNKMGHKNLWMMVPFCHTPEELVKVKRIITGAGLYRSSNFKLWMMVEIPSNVIVLEEFAKAGIDGISIGSNDLTMLTLGVDRDNEVVAPVYDERQPAVMWMFETAIKKANKLGLTSSMCGQAPSVYPDLTAKLVEWGVTSVSVSPDAIERTRQIVADSEHRLARLRR